MRSRWTNIVPIICLFIAAPLGADSVEETSSFWMRDLNSAWKQAKLTERPLLILLKMKDCSYCRLMEDETFKNAGVQQRIQKSYVAALVESAKYPTLVEKLGVRVYPTTVVIGLDGRVTHLISGYTTAKELDRKLRGWQVSAEETSANMR